MQPLDSNFSSEKLLGMMWQRAKARNMTEAWDLIVKPWAEQHSLHIGASEAPRAAPAGHTQQYAGGEQSSGGQPLDETELPSEEKEHESGGQPSDSPDTSGRSGQQLSDLVTGQLAEEP